ncbi:helix-turn-helix transcriptional regulator [Celerinatantimonas yamalensis]|uniref:LuxR family transcriptional regulator n=1 Tax=Celerinatantimonas yamalensis TaxID=559956 RepID=A0ABW9G6F3_9GAMM
MLDLQVQVELLERVRNVSTVKAFSLVCQQITQNLGCDFYLFRLFRPAETTQLQLFLDSNYPKQWLENYLYNCSYDPIFRLCRDYCRPIFWHELKQQQPTNSLSEQFFQEIAKFGIIDGISVAVRGILGEFGILSLSMKRLIEPAEKLNLQLQSQLFVPYLHEAVNRFWRQSQMDYGLSPRERECLSWASQGKTTWEIAQILKLAESTVNYHLNNTLSKTQSSNRQQAIVKALMSGLLMMDFVAKPTVSHVTNDD